MGGDPSLQAQDCAESGPVRDLGCDVVEVEASQLEGEYWRQELATRLQRYRARRKPRTPRYPSLCLPFDAVESRASTVNSSAMHTSSTLAPPSDMAPIHENMALQIAAPESQTQDVAAPRSLILEEAPQSGKVIEFPRSAAIPVFRGNELAEPILDRPRIVEAPEIVPPPPALGGILIETSSEQRADPREDLDFSLPSASIAHRLGAGVLDGLIIVIGLAAFMTVFLRLNAVFPPIPLIVGGAAAVTALLWMFYRFLFVVYTGSTPGLRIARLQLVRFDGSPVPRRVRRWRVLASFLSAFSLGLGYLWSVLDEDGLCWHDRITRTHVIPRLKVGGASQSTEQR